MLRGQILPAFLFHYTVTSHKCQTFLITFYNTKCTFRIILSNARQFAQVLIYTFPRLQNPLYSKQAGLHSPAPPAAFLLISLFSSRV